MSGPERRRQLREIAAQEFAENGLHGASTEVMARRAGITQAYIFRMFGTKKALFLEVVEDAFARVGDGMREAGVGATGVDALAAMGAQYYDRLADRTGLLLQLQGFAACGDPDVRDAVRASFARMWDTVIDGTGVEPVTAKAFLAFGMLLNAGAAMDIDSVDDEWARGVRTLIRPDLFTHITSATNR